jgi:hypothetical protein
MFHSIDSCFACVQSNHADVKELIPEFYAPSKKMDFLINASSLQLGATQMGDRVNDVTLPNWAKSPRDFLHKNARALESNYCTQLLPRWIDLIFGSKSRGEAAKEANNLFHSSSYMGPDDLATLATSEERFQAELQATEFGIIPDQLFIALHPLKHETVDESFVKPNIGRASFTGTEGGEGAWELLEKPPNHKFISPEDEEEEEPVVEVDFDVEESKDQHHPFNSILGSSPRHQFHQSTGNRGGLALSGTGDAASIGGASSPTGFGGIQPSLSNVSSYSGPLSPISPTTQPTQTNTTNAEWDIKFIEKTRIHADTISGCSFSSSSDKSILATTSLDGGLKIHQVSLGGFSKESSEESKTQGITSTLSRFSYITMARGGGGGTAANSSSPKLTELRSHTSRDPLACLALASDGHGGKIAFAGGHDDVVFAYGITSGCAVASIYSHRDAVTGLDLLTRPAIAKPSKLWLEQSTHIMVSGSWDATVKVWSVTVSNGETVSIDREPLAELFDADSPIVCVSAANVSNDGGVMIGAGCADGSFCVWNLHSDGVKVVIHKEQAKRGSGPCSVVQWSSSNSNTNGSPRLHLFTGFATGKVASFTVSNGALRKVSAASVGVAVQCLAYSENILLVGCADGGLRLIATRHGSQFTADLSLWHSINNKSSPGISSVAMSFENDKCICCTGAEDGSVAFFELKRALR